MRTSTLTALVLAWIVAAATGAKDLPPAEGDRAVELMYSGPEVVKGVGASQFEFTQHEKGELLYVASHNTNLRAEAKVSSAVVATLPMATRVRVLAPSSGPTTVIGRVDRWYEVEVMEGSAKGKRGHLFGMLLTPAAWRVDLDGDGEEEIVTAAFAQNFEIRVRIREPKVDDPEHVGLDVKAVGGAYVSQQGGHARVSIVPRAKAGVGLVQVHAYVEACADFATYWISYTVPGAKPGVVGEAKLAMTQAGVADPPVHSDYEVTFDPAQRTAVVVQTDSSEDESGEEAITKETRRYVLQDGVYEKQP